MRRKPTPILLLGAALLAGCEDECTRPGWGQPLSYMAAADVREMVVSGSDRKLYAYRSAAGEPFEIAIAYKAGDRVERCRSGPEFQRFLDAMVTVQVIRQSWHGIYSISSEWFVVELWPAGGDPGVPHRLRPPVPGYAWSVMQWCYGDQYLVDIDPAIWESLRSGCASLGADAPGGA
ncbi:MAG: hypothetical protein K0S81_1359 [Rhodospirillales bacterium]|jgi:hypothetical protein|nr:hypothetical protein [Rhodospirillales bacterium]